MAVTLGILIPTAAHAFTIDPGSIMGLCNILPCNGGGGGAEGLGVYIFVKIITAMQVAIVAVAIFMLFTASRWLVQYSSDEAVTKDARTSFIYIIAGLTTVGLSQFLVMAIAPSYAGIAIVNQGVVEQGAGNVVTYFKMITGITLMVNIVIQAIRLISSQGQEEQVTKARSRLIAGFIGTGIIMLANAIAVAVMPGFGSSRAIAVEIVGISNYLLMILGFLALLAIIVGGVMLIVSVDEGLKDKAKNVIKTAIVALILVLVSYSLVTAFIAI
ncbi:hypothetical protein EXS70_00935 [Candidatus Peribacteria bacterium]|nr:hypothetical protein [Candidatus Peribacteria bacterium]